jgi:hypothetical protein
MAEKAGALCNGDAAVKIALIVEEFLERQAESGNIQDREEE